MINQKGYIALSTVLIILAVIIAITLTMTYSAIGEAQSGLALFKGDENLNFAEGCVEDAMLKARSDPNYNGGTITRPSPEPNCVVTVNSKTGSGTVTWDTDVTVDTTDYKRTININFTRSPTGITLNSWNEI